MKSLKAATRQRIRLVWQMSQAGAPLDAESATLVKAMGEHPEYADLWDRLDTLSEAEIERDGVNPILHVQLHATVENQIAGRDPAEVAGVVEALMGQGLSRHEAIHAVANVLAEEIAMILRDHRPFNESLYLKKLRRLIKKR